jgi:hypothetical protein
MMDKKSRNQIICDTKNKKYMLKLLTNFAERIPPISLKLREKENATYFSFFACSLTNGGT